MAHPIPRILTGPASTNGLHLAFEAPGTNATPTQDAAYTGAASGTGAAPMDYAIGAQPAAGAGVPVYAGTGPASVQQLSPAALAPGTHGAGLVGSVLAAGPSRRLLAAHGSHGGARLCPLDDRQASREHRAEHGPGAG